jgi:hypothetical protein
MQSTMLCGTGRSLISHAVNQPTAWASSSARASPPGSSARKTVRRNPELPEDSEVRSNLAKGARIGCPEPRFLLEFTQGRVLKRLVRLHPAAGEGIHVPGRGIGAQHQQIFSVTLNGD